MEFLVDPGKVSRNGEIAMAAGIWFYMTPQAPKPSMHDVMSGRFIPNQTDMDNNIFNKFSTTINIINGGLECGKGLGYDKVVKRGQYFLNWLDFFGLPAEDDLDCGNQPNQFPTGGASDILHYFDKDWAVAGACKVSPWPTQYSAFARDDYKRCVCDLWGNGAADCAKGPDDTSNQEFGDDSGIAPETEDAEEDVIPEPSEYEEDVQPNPEPAEDGDPEPSGDDNVQPSPSPDVWRTWATLQQIRDTPHYSESSYSRTLYQVDRELDFIEEKIAELFEVAIQNGLITA